MAKIALITDTHWGVRNDSPVFLDYFKKCMDEFFFPIIDKQHIDTIIHLGDLVDRRKYVNINTAHRLRTDFLEPIHQRAINLHIIAGNHDEFLRPMIPYGFSFGLVEIHNQTEHIGADGKHYLVTHGDLFDGITRLAPWLAFLGDKAYDFILSFNSKFNWIRHKFGFGYFSLSQYLKARVKKAVDFIFQFEKNLAAYCKKRGFDGVICGHIHHAEIKDIDGVMYMNDGDWVESCTALVEHHDGRWEIITWTKEKDDDETL